MSKIELLNIDCMEYMATVPDKYFDLAMVDPQYGIGQTWMKSKTTYKYGRNEFNNKPMRKKYFTELFRISKNQIIWGANYYCHYLPIRNSWLIWDKNRNAGKTFMSECELAWTSFNIVMQKVKLTWDGINKCEKSQSNIHPFQRPINLYKWELEKFAMPEFKIIDTHGGSMSSVIACYDFGISEMVCCEIDKEYFEAGKKRFEIHKMQQKLF
jgi:site-specific DNA-methyltransferase (adenine-specific)